MKGFYGLSLLFLIISLFAGGIQCDPIVTIPDGKLIGADYIDYDGGVFHSFKAIPFAKAPLADLRFKEPIKNDPWTGERDATNDGPLCIQFNYFGVDDSMIGTEDCLYLNVYTKSIEQNRSVPVLFYIHGGAFVLGWGGEFGAEFLLTRDIVLVTINYRLGVFGFVNLVDSQDVNEEDKMSANNGFRDQILALQWVQDNIKYFGGDPNSVTIAGESAGGMSVHALILSPLAKGLFHRAIPMSGSTVMVMVPTANNTAIDIAKYLNICTTNHSSMIRKMRQSSTEDLFNAMKELHWFDIQLDSPNLSAMVIEKPHPSSFISDYPLHLIRTGNYNKVPMLIGTTNMEGLLIQTLTQENAKDLSINIPFFFSRRDEAEKKVKNYYSINTTSDINNITMYSDIWFKFNAWRTAIEHSKQACNGDVYYYQFEGDAGINYLKPWNPIIAGYEGACHADELGYLFKCARLPEIVSGSTEEMLMKNLVNAWVNFVQNGKPHCGWLPFKPDLKDNFYGRFTNDGLQFGTLKNKAFKFWTKMYEEYGNGLY